MDIKGIMSNEGKGSQQTMQKLFGFFWCLKQLNESNLLCEQIRTTNIVIQ
jgi:hypothetical protein